MEKVNEKYYAGGEIPFSNPYGRRLKEPLYPPTPLSPLNPQNLLVLDVCFSKVRIKRKKMLRLKEKIEYIFKNMRLSYNMVWKGLFWSSQIWISDHLIKWGGQGQRLAGLKDLMAVGRIYWIIKNFCL